MPKLNKRTVYAAASSLIVLILLVVGFYGYLYASTPAHIKKPTYEHYHFRTQVIVNGKAVDFSKDEFQEEYNSTTCSAEVGGVPIDFHDKMDQMTHVHWNGMTGGEFLKYFGWNYIGGNDDLLGRRFDAGLVPQSVKIYGKLLPAVPEKANFYIYVGDKDSYEQKDWNSFLNKDLEEFFGKKSNLGQAHTSEFSVLNWLFLTAYAHGGEVDEHPSDKSEEELSSINNLIGNVVIFVQENEPTKEQIQARFNDLVPLQESTCGG